MEAQVPRPRARDGLPAFQALEIAAQASGVINDRQLLKAVAGLAERKHIDAFKRHLLAIRERPQILEMQRNGCAAVGGFKDIEKRGFRARGIGEEIAVESESRALAIKRRDDLGVLGKQTAHVF